MSFSTVSNVQPCIFGITYTSWWFQYFFLDNLYQSIMGWSQLASILLVKSPKHDQPQHLHPFSQAFFRLDGIFVGLFPLIQASTLPLQKKTPWEINTCVDWQSLESAMSSPLGGFVVWTCFFFPNGYLKLLKRGKWWYTNICLGILDKSKWTSWGLGFHRYTWL